ncbi:Baseplate protein J-like [uncultured Caudovirales phage]|uniref:Baseplate protein J-like n=1 Tax=uncultured Caudovirales phage TaxID=2100421 RepID=A0A6J5NYP6_9CAUD|nr:Baseplate protein J-like [uncultured Caudovirales phage]
MPQYITTSSSKEISDKIKTNLSLSLGLEVSNDSITSILSESVGSELAALNNKVKNTFESYFLSTATGADLDRLGIQMYNLPRRSASTASCLSSDRNVHIFLNPLSGYSSFSEANGGQPILIPKGTAIGERRNTPNTINIINYVTTNDLILDSNRIVYIGVRAVNSGANYNIGSNILKELEFSDYANFRNNVLLVNNSYPILNGNDSESDESYRYRLSLYLTSRNKTNYNSIIISALNTPGVIDAKVIPGYYGIGTIGLILFGANKLVDNQMISEAERNIRANLSNLNIKVSAGVYLFLNMNINLKSTKRFTPTEEKEILANIKNSINDFLLNYESETISLDQINTRLFGNLISNYGIAFNKNDKVFSDIKLKKSLDINNPDYVLRNVIDNKITLKNDERILPGNINLNITYLNGV